MRFLRRSGGTAGADDLLARIRAASAAHDEEQLASICRANRDAILTAFPGWWPLDKRWEPEDPELNAYVQAVGQVAQFFARELGHPELLETLIGPLEKNPGAIIHGKLREADELLKVGQFEQTVERSLAILDDLEKMKGTAIPELAAYAYGRLGQGYFGVGRVEEGLQAFTYAAQLALQEHDAEGVRINTMRRYECLRYLGRSKEAAEALEIVVLVIEAQGRPVPNWVARQVELVRSGEPLVRLVGVIDDERYEVDDLTDALRDVSASMTTVRFDQVRNRPQIPRAAAMADRARWLASQGQLEDALAMFDGAAAVDPHDPHPVYNSGLALLQLGRFADAGVRFDRTEALAPGWFLCRRYGWLAGELAAGRVSAQIIPLLMLAEADDQSVEQRLRLLADAASVAPDLGWVSLQEGSAFQAAGRLREAEHPYRVGLTKRVDDDVRSMLLVNLAIVLGAGTPEAQRLFGEVGTLAKGHLLAYASARLALIHN